MPRYKLIDPTGRIVAFPFAEPVSPAIRPFTADATVALPAADLRVDFTGDTCLRTNLVTKRMLDALGVGQVLEVISDNLSAVETIPFMLEGHGCEHLASVHHTDHWRIYARKRVPAKPEVPGG